MFQLNENSMKRIMREEYFKRLKHFLQEEMSIMYKSGSNEIDVLSDASKLKVRNDKSGLEYTVLKYDKANKKVVLLCPEFSRFDSSYKPKSTKKLTEVDEDDLTIKLDKIDSLLDDTEQNNSRKVTNDKIKLMDFNKEDDVSISKNKDYIIVDLDEFIKEYSL
jgi:hypothetical protein